MKTDTLARHMENIARGMRITISRQADKYGKDHAVVRELQNELREVEDFGTELRSGQINLEQLTRKAAETKK